MLCLFFAYRFISTPSVDDSGESLLPDDALTVPHLHHRHSALTISSVSSFSINSSDDTTMSGLQVHSDSNHVVSYSNLLLEFRKKKEHVSAIWILFIAWFIVK